MQFDFRCTLWYWQGLESHLDSHSCNLDFTEVWNVALRTQSATASVWDFYFCFPDHYRPKYFHGLPSGKQNKECALFFLEKTFPLVSTSVGQVLVGQAKLGPERLEILTLFSPWLQKTTGITLSLDWISFCFVADAFSFFSFFVKGAKQFWFRSVYKKEGW